MSDTLLVAAIVLGCVALALLCAGVPRWLRRPTAPHRADGYCRTASQLEAIWSDVMRDYSARITGLEMTRSGHRGIFKQQSLRITTLEQERDELKSWMLEMTVRVRELERASGTFRGGALGQPQWVETDHHNH